ncbi:MAG: hypothetical protein M9885_03585 [Burkholderiaceae bacterium]|nr:hypothetical protein [Burkholderiaceae bacterium]
MLARLAVSVVLATAAAGAFAQAHTPRIDQRQSNQERRIDQGVQSGALTAREAGRLDAGQERVERMEDRAKADGVVTRRERAKLTGTQNVQSRRIWKQKHDRQHARR